MDPVVFVEATNRLKFESDRYDIPETAVLNIEIPVTVVWISRSGLPHTVTPVGHQEFPKGESSRVGEVILEHMFETLGLYEYRCDYHWQLGMRGAIMVYPGGTVSVNQGAAYDDYFVQGAAYDALTSYSPVASPPPGLGSSRSVRSAP